MNNKELIVKISNTVKANFSTDEIEKIIQKYTHEEYKVNYVGGTGNFIELPDFKVALHAKDAGGRNAFIAQYWTPILKYLNDFKIIQYIDEKIDSSTIKSDYHKFIFRCLKTMGVEIDGLSFEVKPWESLEEFLSSRASMEKKNNNSSYVTVDDNSIVLFGKTYGAQAGEALIFLATLNLLKGDRHLFYTPMPENKTDNSVDPSKNMLDFIAKIGAKFIYSTPTQEQQAIKTHINNDEDEEIRNQALFKLHLDKKFEHKCYVCGSSGLGILVASHIDRVTDIKKRSNLSKVEKTNLATSMENGLWLCRNHDILFEHGNMWFDTSGNLQFKEQILAEENAILYSMLVRNKIEDKHFTEDMQKNLELHRKRTNN